MSNRIFIDDCQHWLNDTQYPLAGGYDLIYIDPPYDTGTKFSYHDKRDDWTEWMAPKIQGGYDHLREDGAMFISIDDNRLIELCLLCDEIFGTRNRLAIMVTHQSQRSNAKHINIVHEYVVVYAKDKKKLPKMSIPRIHTGDVEIIQDAQAIVDREMRKNGREAAQKALRKAIRRYKAQGVKWISNYRCVDDDGRIFFPQDLSVPGEPNTVDIPEIGLHLDPLPTRRWSSEAKFKELHDKGLLENLDGRPYEKHYLSDAEDAVTSLLPFYSRQGTEDLKRLGCGDLFDTPKPVGMIEMFVLAMASGRDEVRVLDFFGGSGTTGQAVWQAAEKMPEKVMSFDIIQINEDMREGTKPYKKALKLGISPNIAVAIQHRLDTFLADHPNSDGYEYVLVSE